MSGAPISVKVGSVLQKIPHVVDAAPVYWAFSQKPLEIDYGIDLDTYDGLPPEFRYLSGGPFQGPNDALVDDSYAEQNHKQVGDTVEILNHEYRIAGIVPHGKGGRKFSTAWRPCRSINGQLGRCSVFYSNWMIPRTRMPSTTRSRRRRAWSSMRCARCRSICR